MHSAHARSETGHLISSRQFFTSTATLSRDLASGMKEPALVKLRLRRHCRRWSIIMVLGSKIYWNTRFKKDEAYMIHPTSVLIVHYNIIFIFIDNSPEPYFICAFSFHREGPTLHHHQPWRQGRLVAEVGLAWRQFARTSGVLWQNSGARDHRQFPGATKKTLQRQSFESVFVPGASTSYNVGYGEQDPLQWPEVRPPDLDQPSCVRLKEAFSPPLSCFLKKSTNQNQGQKIRLRVLELWMLVICLYWFICI